jgi:hypothetical protein
MGLALGAGQSSQTPSATIPERFQGDWSADLSHCHDRESGQNVAITADALTYFEAGDTVVSVTPAESNGIHVVVDHEDYDGMERLGRTMILSDDLQTLSFTYGDGPEWTVLRCPRAE